MKQGQFPEIIQLSNLDGQYGFKIDGEFTGDQSGCSVSRAGDVNGDQYADLLIGACGYSGFTGRSYVVFGGPETGANGLLVLSTLNGTNGFKLDSEITGGFNGVSTSGIGDTNGDGYDDLLIGAPWSNGYRGYGYVVLGGSEVGSSGIIDLAALDGANGFKINGEFDDDQSAWTVGKAGDVNGDGYPDILLGAYNYPGGNGVGRSYVIFGGPGVGSNGLINLADINATTGLRFDGELNNDHSSVVGTAGDINKDGYADVLMGAFGYPGLGNNGKGRSYVVFGGPMAGGSSGVVALSSLNGTVGFKLDGEFNNDENGRFVNIVRDINSDGYDDLFIGAPWYPAGSNKGRSYIVFGGPEIGSNGTIALSSLNGITGFILDGEFNGDQSGLFVNSAGDFNGDGYGDLITGAYGYPAGNETGRSYVVFGGPSVGEGGTIALADLDGVIGFKLDGEFNGDRSCSVSTVGDVNGDGVDDLLIGAFGYNSSTGRSYVVFGDIAPIITQNSLSLSQGNAVLLNSSFLEAYDRNHANSSIVFIPTAVTHGHFEELDQPGIAITNFTQPQLVTGNILFVHDGGRYPPSYNMTVRSAGIAWTGPQPAVITFTTVTKSQFPAMVQLSSLNGQNGFKLDGEANSDNNGRSVNTAGDINGDGYVDLVISADGHSGSTGRSYVVFGGPAVGGSGLLALSSLNGTNGFKLDGEMSNDYSGQSVGTVGDMNGDGYADLVIGAYGHYSYTGRSYVVFGGPAVGGSGLIALSSLNGTNGFKLDGEVSGDRSGFSVSAAGDVNGDDYADLVIGAWGASRSYVVFGGSTAGGSGLLALSSLDGTNGFKLYGEAPNDYCGLSVSTAGDINGDGYADLLVGAQGYNNFVGRSYVVFGGTTVGNNGLLALSDLNGTNGFKLDGETTNDDSGSSVHTAGDINGDGIADLIIGAYQHANSAGRSYVVFGSPMIGGNGLLALSSLNGTNGFKLNGEINGDQSGLSVSTAGDINGDGYADLVMGAIGRNGATGCSYVVFGDTSPVLINNTLVLHQGENVLIDSTSLVATSVNHNNNSLIFILSSVMHGQFENVNFPGIPLANFTQQQVSNASIHFVSDGNSQLPTYNITVGSPGIAIAGPFSAQITFFPRSILQSNQLWINQGQRLLINSTFLSVIDAYPADQVNLTISNIQHGHFELAPQNISVTLFNEQQLTMGQIYFTHDNSDSAPSYSVEVQDPYFTLSPSPAAVNFYATPIIPISSSSSSSSSSGDSSSIGYSSFSTSESSSTISSSTGGSIPDHPSQTNNLSLIITVGAVVGGVAAVSIFLCCVYARLRKKRAAAPAALSLNTLQEAQRKAQSYSFNPLTTSVSQSQAAVELGPSGYLDRSSMPSLPSPSAMQSVFSEKSRELSLSVEPPSRSDYHSFSSQQFSAPSPITVPLSQPGRSESGEGSDLKVSRPASPSSPKLIDERGEMKISLGLAYEDLEFDEKDQLGSGGYGRVYKGTYKFNEVAIKKLHAEHLSDGALDELKQEAGILGAMRSDYIVQLRGICLEAPNYCLVMELMPKGSLYALLKNSPDLPLSVRYRIGADIGYGLYHLHEMNILHRDLKSLNVLLDDRLRAKITDFGLSKMKSEMGSASSSKGMKGTLGWMAPELFQEKPEATSAADIYAYGMVLWELMIRPYRIPFENLAPASLITAKLTRGDQQEKVPDACPPKMAQLMQRCWQTSEKRPPIKALAQSLNTLFLTADREEKSKRGASLSPSVSVPAVVSPVPVSLSQSSLLFGPAASGVPLPRRSSESRSPALAALDQPKQPSLAQPVTRTISLS